MPPQGGGLIRPGEAWQARSGLERQGRARLGNAGLDWRGEAWQGTARHGLAAQAWNGMDWPEETWRGKAGKSGTGEAGCGKLIISQEKAMKFTKELRQEILDDFVSRKGKYDATAFLEEVREQGDSHPAWTWFEWNNDKAAQEHRLWQARTFVQGLRVKFEVITTERSISGVVVRDAPAYVSPVETRANGGGYFQTDIEDPGHRREILRQALLSLDTWIRRYGGTFEASGGDVTQMEGVRSHIVRQIEGTNYPAIESSAAAIQPIAS